MPVDARCESHIEADGRETKRTTLFRDSLRFNGLCRAVVYLILGRRMVFLRNAWTRYEIVINSLEGCALTPVRPCVLIALFFNFKRRDASHV